MGTISNCHCKDPYKPIRGFKGSWRLRQGFGSRALILKVLCSSVWSVFFWGGGQKRFFQGRFSSSSLRCLVCVSSVSQNLDPCRPKKNGGYIWCSVAPPPTPPVDGSWSPSPPVDVELWCGALLVSDASSSSSSRSSSKNNCSTT